jgi:putative ABC transport system permease protein
VTDALYLAWAHVRFHAGRSTILVLVLAILGAIPLLTGRLAALAEAGLLERAASTPLVYGAPGSPLDLSLSALFFEGAPRAELTMADYEKLREMRLGLALPILRTHTARGFPVVGIDVDYLAFRDLSVERGRPMLQLGEAVLGAEVAERLDLGPGGRVQSETGRIFELAGAYPVRMPVAGVLAPSGTADDRAVFVDLATAWIVAGIGHGHEDLATSRDESVVLSREAGRIVANAKLTEYIDISPENADAFHLHGDPSRLPLSAVLVAPSDERSAAILRGRIEDGGPGRQVFRPLGVIRGLLDEVFRVKSVLDLLVAAVTVAALLALAMIIALSLKLRRREFEVARQLGADRGAMARLVMAELALLVAGGVVLCALLLVAVEYRGAELVRALVFGA